ncbi:Uncharacterised protein [Mycobacteroides abscessus subsp. abscessus]|nr:Uncharacterised protein [Mycobacteroides abscessus subsp. abscessus]SHW02030.1 Uncharacterised protein [Mycobacteroides abscessus subsp. abscessus]
MDMGIDKRGRDEGTFQVHDLGIRKLGPTEVVLADPADDIAGHRHGGRGRMRRAVHAGVDE